MSYENITPSGARVQVIEMRGISAARIIGYLRERCTLRGACARIAKQRSPSVYLAGRGKGHKVVPACRPAEVAVVARVNGSKRVLFFDSFEVKEMPETSGIILGAYTLIKYEETFSIIDQFGEV